MVREEILTRLLSAQDIPYRDFQSGLIPTVDPSSMIGVRTPELRKITGEFSKREDISGFLSVLPHEFFEEDQIHAFIISGIRDFADCIKEVERFLPFVNNWATCDQMGPKVFKKHKDELLPYIESGLKDDHTYTVRFAVKMLMDHFLDDAFDPLYPQLVASVISEEYYINMMRAWYFATALAKQYDPVFPYISERRLDRWTHNRAIQKAVESYRISDERKEELKTLRWR